MTGEQSTGARAPGGGGAQALAPFDPALDHFERLGISRGTSIDRDAFEQAYLTRSASVHPDRFVTADAATQRRAMEHASAVNEAYRTLRDPVRRAEYLVKLAGIDLDSSAPEGGAPQPGQAFLIEMIERREALAEHRMDGRLDEFRDAIDDEREDSIDAAIDALEAGDVTAAAHALVKARYLSRLLHEIGEIEEGPRADG